VLYTLTPIFSYILTLTKKDRILTTTIMYEATFSQSNHSQEFSLLFLVKPHQIGESTSPNTNEGKDIPNPATKYLAS
jgi:hypothetical protein